MANYKPLCPKCEKRNTRIRTSKQVTPDFQVLYCDCMDETCLTRFKINMMLEKIIWSLDNEQEFESEKIEHAE